MRLRILHDIGKHKSRYPIVINNPFSHYFCHSSRRSRSKCCLSILPDETGFACVPERIRLWWSCKRRFAHRTDTRWQKHLGIREQRRSAANLVEHRENCESPNRSVWDGFGIAFGVPLATKCHRETKMSRRIDWPTPRYILPSFWF